MFLSIILLTAAQIWQDANLGFFANANHLSFVDVHLIRFCFVDVHLRSKKQNQFKTSSLLQLQFSSELMHSDDCLLYTSDAADE